MSERPGASEPSSAEPADSGGSEVWRRKARCYGWLAGVSVLAVVLLAGALYAERRSGSNESTANGPGASARASEVDEMLASLDGQPVDPTEVRLVSTVSTFADCGALIDDLRLVGARHVGSQGFGASHLYPLYADGDDSFRETASADSGAATAMPVSGELAYTGGADGTTLGTNVQVEGVDELDMVKAVGDLIYDIDRNGNLRITDAGSLEVLATLDVTPGDGEPASRYGGGASVNQLLVSDGQVVLFGTEVEVSEPVEGDPSATRSSTTFMTVTFVDASDPASMSVTDRVRIEGSLVAARLVDGEVRLVTTSNMADLGFLMPTTPNSVARALDANRRSVAGSAAADWIPDWQRDGGDPTPLVPCERVHVPDTFAGVAMTSMVTFPVTGGRFDPSATSILAPADTLYAGLERVAISSHVWVDPIDRDRLEFDDWQTAVHEFRFAEDLPTYVGSGIVDGSTIGQFAFGEIGDSLAVVTTKGVPWRQDTNVGVDLTVLTPDGGAGLGETAKVADLADDKGEVTAVRFVEDRVLVSTGAFGRELHVIDVTDPSSPRRAGMVRLTGTVGYFHPLPDHQALMVATRTDQVGTGDDRQVRDWVQGHLLDVSDPDAPSVVSTWEVPWFHDSVGYDHHAFTYWPERKLAMWGLQDTRWELRDQDRSNVAAVLSTDGGVTEVAVPTANRPNEVDPPCPPVEVTDPDAQQMMGPGSIVLRCAEKDLESVEWPRYECYRVDDYMISRFAPGEEDQASFQLCSPAQPPTVSRVLVVAGRPILLTDQTLEALDPATFASIQIAYHPSSGVFGY